MTIRKQKQFRSTMRDLLRTLFCLSFSASSPARYLTTDPAGRIGPGGNAQENWIQMLQVRLYNLRLVTGHTMITCHVSRRKCYISWLCNVLCTVNMLYTAVIIPITSICIFITTNYFIKPTNSRMMRFIPNRSLVQASRRQGYVI